MSNKAIDIAIRAAENQLAKEVNSEFSARMAASVQEIGQVDTMRHTILTYVAAENYERAIKELQDYVASKVDYPQFKQRAGRYVSYAIDLINAIKAKRSFPGIHLLSISKQQELFDRGMAHFEDLKATLRKIELIDREVRIQDVRSTILVVKAAVYSCFAILVCLFLLDVSRGTWPTIARVLDSLFLQGIDYLFDLTGL